MDGMTKSALWHYWVRGEGNNELMDDIESSDEELKDSDHGNLVNDIILNNAPHSDNIKDEKLNERVCKAEKFEVIKYSLGPNEEHITVNTCECNAWKRNEDSVSHIYQEIFQKKDKGWTVTHTKE
ncbi:hypothetical protein Tco_0518169 [Tanacetum coccineum]